MYSEALVKAMELVVKTGNYDAFGKSLIEIRPGATRLGKHEID